jgi:hypothetical protein
MPKVSTLTSLFVNDFFTSIRATGASPQYSDASVSPPIRFHKNPFTQCDSLCRVGSVLGNRIVTW